jgi:hypothetical protein
MEPNGPFAEVPIEPARGKRFPIEVKTSAAANQRGEYRLYDLPAGDYVVSAAFANCSFYGAKESNDPGSFISLSSGEVRSDVSIGLQGERQKPIASYGQTIVPRWQIVEVVPPLRIRQCRSKAITCRPEASPALLGLVPLWTDW